MKTTPYLLQYQIENSRKNAHDSVAGADQVHYKLLKHLPRISLQTL